MSIIVFILDKIGGAIVSLPVIMLLAFLFDRKRAKQKWGWLILYVLYMNAMLIVIGVPDYKYASWHPTVNLIPFQDFTSSNILGMVLNVVMLIPLGAFLPIYFSWFQKWYRTLAAGFGMSLLIEIIQLFTFRATDIDDLLMNSLGTLLGYFVVKLLFKHQKGKIGDKKDWIKLSVINVIIILVIVFVRYPLMDVIFSRIGY